MNPTPTPDSPSPQPVDIARLRALLAKATQKPISFEYAGSIPVLYGLNDDDSGMAFDNEDDAIFIAALRNDAPALLDELDLHRKKQDEIIALCESERVHHPAVAINRLKAERDKLREEVERLRTELKQEKQLSGQIQQDAETFRASERRLSVERDSWKASHDNQVNLRRTLMDRPDLGDRAKRMQELISERDSLRQENAELKAKLK